jgi:hypothetical protein
MTDECISPMLAQELDRQLSTLRREGGEHEGEVQINVSRN